MDKFHYAKVKEAGHNRLPIIVWSHFYEISRKDKENILVIAQGWGLEWEMTANGHKGPLWDDGNVIKLACGNGCTIL